MSKHIPVVMLSTTSNTRLIHEAYDNGINAFLEKPILQQDFVKLAEAIDVCFLNASRPAEISKKEDKYGGSIVIIEDNEDQRYFIKLALKESMPRVEVYEYDNGQAALTDFKEKWLSLTPAPQLILMDLYMPTRQAGLDLLLEMHQVLKSKNGCSTPVVVFTNSKDPDDRKMSYEHNANAFMIKDKDVLHWKNDFQNLHHFWWNTVSY